MPVTALPHISRPPNASGIQAAYICNIKMLHCSSTHTERLMCLVYISLHRIRNMSAVSKQILYCNLYWCWLCVSQRCTRLQQRPRKMQICKSSHSKAGIFWSCCKESSLLRSFLHKFLQRSDTRGGTGNLGRPSPLRNRITPF